MSPLSSALTAETLPLFDPELDALGVPAVLEFLLERLEPEERELLTSLRPGTVFQDERHEPGCSALEGLRGNETSSSVLFTFLRNTELCLTCAPAPLARLRRSLTNREIEALREVVWAHDFSIDRDYGSPSEIAAWASELIYLRKARLGAAGAVRVIDAELDAARSQIASICTANPELIQPTMVGPHLSSEQVDLLRESLSLPATPAHRVLALAPVQRVQDALVVHTFFWATAPRIQSVGMLDLMLLPREAYRRTAGGSAPWVVLPDTRWESPAEAQALTLGMEMLHDACRYSVVLEDIAAAAARIFPAASAATSF